VPAKVSRKPCGGPAAHHGGSGGRRQPETHPTVLPQASEDGAVSDASGGRPFAKYIRGATDHRLVRRGRGRRTAFLGLAVFEPIDKSAFGEGRRSASFTERFRYDDGRHWRSRSRAGRDRAELGRTAVNS
jgi:hypothetical protein